MKQGGKLPGPLGLMALKRVDVFVSKSTMKGGPELALWLGSSQLTGDDNKGGNSSRGGNTGPSTEGGGGGGESGGEAVVDPFAASVLASLTNLTGHPILLYSMEQRNESPKSLVVPEFAMRIHVHVGDAGEGAVSVTGDEMCARWLHVLNRWVGEVGTSREECSLQGPQRHETGTGTGTGVERSAQCGGSMCSIGG